MSICLWKLRVQNEEQSTKLKLGMIRKTLDEENIFTGDEIRECHNNLLYEKQSSEAVIKFCHNNSPQVFIDPLWTARVEYNLDSLIFCSPVHRS